MQLQSLASQKSDHFTSADHTVQRIYINVMERYTPKDFSIVLETL